MQEIGKSAVVVGAAPEGASDPRSAARAVREMFTAIAPRYDLLNHVLSFNIDRMWWRRTARAFRAHSVSPRRTHSRLVLRNRGHGVRAAAASRELFAADSRRRFLARHAAARRCEIRCSRRPKVDRPGWIEADALNLPIPDRSLRFSDFSFRFPQSRRLRCWIARDRPRAASRRRVRHPRFRRARWNDGGALPHLFQTNPAARGNRDFRRPRSLCLSPRIGRAFPGARRNARQDETRRLCRSHLDALHVRNRRSVSRRRSSAQGRRTTAPLAAVCSAPEYRPRPRLPPRNTAAHLASSSPG